MRNFKNISGFSLVELSVTLLIIGIVIAAITSGSSLLQAAKINKTISEITGYVAAVNNFKDKYKAWPGDMPNATSYWGATVTNGNGDEEILDISVSENLLAWRQLALSGLIAGNYTGTYAESASGDSEYFAAGINSPASSSAYKGSYYFLGSHFDVFDTTGISLQLGSSKGYYEPWGGALSPEDTHIIDVKIDDGLASTGNFYGFRSNIYLGVANRCVDNDYNVSSANYVLTDRTVNSCRMFYWIKKD